MWTEWEDGDRQREKKSIVKAHRKVLAARTKALPAVNKDGEISFLQISLFIVFAPFD